MSIQEAKTSGFTLEKSEVLPSLALSGIDPPVLTGIDPPRGDRRVGVTAILWRG